MTTPTNWPNPERPGVPMFPERDGWHVLKWSHSPALKWDKAPKTSCGWEIWEWNSDVKKWGAVEPKGMVNEGYEYISPILTPTQLAELLAGERERFRNEIMKEVSSLGTNRDLKEYSGDITKTQIMAVICNLGDAP